MIAPMSMMHPWWLWVNVPVNTIWTDDTTTTKQNTTKPRAYSWDILYYWLIDWKKHPGPWFNIKMASHQYRKFHCGDKTVVRSSYLHNGISYAGKMTSLYWFSPLIGFLRTCRQLLHGGDISNSACIWNYVDFDLMSCMKLSVVSSKFITDG